jgi:hypothetical protein
MKLQNAHFPSDATDGKRSTWPDNMSVCEYLASRLYSRDARVRAIPPFSTAFTS